VGGTGVENREPQSKGEKLKIATGIDSGKKNSAEDLKD